MRLNEWKKDQWTSLDRLAIWAMLGVGLALWAI